MVNPVSNRSCYESYFLTPIRNFLRPLFFPLFSGLPEEIEKEKQFFKEFWDTSFPVRPEIARHKDVRNNFNCKTLELTIALNGRPLKVNCSIIESKNVEQGKDCYNLVHVLGNTATLNSDIMDTYPLVEAYLSLETKPPARFILINQYSTFSSDGTVYKPETLSEAGFILSETLKATEESFGTIDQLVAFSLGGIVTAAALPYFHTNPVSSEKALPASLLEIILNQSAELLSKFCKYTSYPLQGRINPVNPENETVQKTARVFKSLPKNIVFDRAPSSIRSLSDRYTGGALLAYLAKNFGWDVDIGKAIFDFVKNCGETAPSITTVSALRDHRFKGKANLYMNPYIQQLVTEKKVTPLVLDIVMQFVNENAQHSLSTGIWNRFHLVNGYKEQDFLLNDESLAFAIVKNSLPKEKLEESREKRFRFPPLLKEINKQRAQTL